MTAVEADNGTATGCGPPSRNSRLQRGAIRCREKISRSGRVFGFNRFEIVYFDYDRVAVVLSCAEQKSAGLQAPLRKRFKSLSDRHRKAAGHVRAKPDG